jgi:hypothetical protein
MIYSLQELKEIWVDCNPWESCDMEVNESGSEGYFCLRIKCSIALFRVPESFLVRGFTKVSDVLKIYFIIV